MFKFKRISTLFLSLSLLTSALVGCSSSSEGDKSTGSKASTNLPEARYTIDPNTPAWKLDPAENVKLTWYVNVDWWSQDFGTDYVTKILKEDLNIDVTFQVGDDTKLNGLFGSGQLPDIITVMDTQSQVAKKANTWAWSLNELADKYDPYFYNVINKETFDWTQLSDGKTYGYPSYSNTTEDYENGYLQAADFFVMREDIYNALGKPDMSDGDKFISTLKEIKAKYPQIAPIGIRSFTSGINPTTSSLGDKFQDFLGVPLVTEDNQFYDRNLDPEYLRWIKTFNRAYQEGLISDDAFSDDNATFEEKLASGRYATSMITGVPQLTGTLQKNIADDPARKYIAIDGPKSSLGNEPTLPQSGISGWTLSLITKNCVDPQKAIQIFTYLISDYGRQVCFYGLENETFLKDENGKFYFTPEVEAMRKDNPDNFKKTYRFGEFCLFGVDSFAAKNGKDNTVDATRQMVEWGKGKVKPHFVLENYNPEAGSAEARNLKNIDSYWATTLANLIRAKNDAEFDKYIEDYKKFLKDTGWDKIVAIRSEKIQSNIQRLGLK